MKTSYDPSRARWRVTYQDDGFQRRRFFTTEAEAKAFSASRREDAKLFGVAWPSRTPLERAEIEIQLDRLRRSGWTMRAAVDYALEHGKTPASLPLGDVAEKCLRAKEAKGCRPRTLRKFRTTLDRFLVGRRDRPVSGIMPAEIQEFLTRNGWSAATSKSCLIDLRTLFAWAVRNRMTRDNPAMAVELPRLEDKPPGILTPAQAAELMSHGLRVEPGIVATLALCLFGGVPRPEEARRLTWENVGADYVDIARHKAKTRRRRLVTITPQLRAWLEIGQAVESSLPVANYAYKFARVRRAAGLLDAWPQDRMRHSFASYHMAKHRNENHTAQEMGNSPQMILAHYRELVKPVEAQAFFGILPSDAATPCPSLAADATKATPARNAQAARRARKITAEILGAMFQHGARELTKPEAWRCYGKSTALLNRPRSLRYRKRAASGHTCGRATGGCRGIRSRNRKRRKGRRQCCC